MSLDGCKDTLRIFGGLHNCVKVNAFYDPILLVGEGTAETEINSADKYYHPWLAVKCCAETVYLI